MLFNQQFTPNLKLLHTSTEDFNEDWSPMSVRFTFNFFDELMYAVLQKKHYDRDIPFFTGFGAAELFDSFESLLEDHFQEIKECFQKHIDHAKEEVE